MCAFGHLRRSRLRIGSVCTTSPIALGLISRMRRGGDGNSSGVIAPRPRGWHRQRRLRPGRRPRLPAPAAPRSIPDADPLRVLRRVLRMLAQAAEQPLDGPERRREAADAVDVDDHRHRADFFIVHDDPVRRLRVVQQQVAAARGWRSVPAETMKRASCARAAPADRDPSSPANRPARARRR